MVPYTRRFADAPGDARFEDVEVALARRSGARPAARVGAEPRDLLPQLLADALSFVVIGRYWFSHHRMFRSLQHVDGTLLWLNLKLLGFVALLPFPTQVLGDYGDTTRRPGRRLRHLDTDRVRVAGRREVLLAPDHPVRDRPEPPVRAGAVMPRRASV